MKTSLTQDGWSFYTRFTVIAYGLSCVAPGGVVIYLIALLRLSPEQVSAFWGWVLAVAIISTPVGTPTFLHITGPIRRYLDARAKGDAPTDVVQAAFAATVNLPRRLAVIATLLVVWPASMIALGMKWQFADFGWQNTLVIMAAGLGCAPCSGLIQAYALKAWLTPLRDHLAGRIDDPPTEGSLIRRLSLRTKLQWAITATTVAPVLFAILYALESGYGSVERHVAEGQPYWLASVDLDALGAWGAEEAGLAVEQARLRALGLEARLAIVDRSVEADDDDLVRYAATPTGATDRVALTTSEIAAVRDAPEAGTSGDLQTANVFQWAAIDRDRSLVVFTPREVLRTELGSRLIVFGAVLLAAVLFGSLMGRIAADDLGRSTFLLVAEADRIADGDLSSNHRVVSEDELGKLGRTFVEMRTSLRATVSQVSDAADRVEAGSGLVHEAAAQMTRGAEEAARGLGEAGRSMDTVRDQSGDVGRSASGLSHIVDQSGTASAQVLAASEELSQTAAGLSGQVDSVSSSLEEMARSVRQVRENGDSLRAAADDTSTSVGEMVRSMNEVDTTTDRTAQLAEQVERAASEGRETVQRTISGMAAIRDATDATQEVITGLGASVEQIGAILDVIDSVADETNLLALNAAIIAAQSGEQGRAFAVVADEIKQLADRVLASTKEISDVIRGVQHESGRAVKAIAFGADSVAAGVALAEEAGRSLEEIDRTSRESGTCIQQIASAVREQTDAAGRVASLMENVLGGIEQIQRAAQEHERGSETVLRSTEQMREGAHLVARTMSEQASGNARIRDGIEGVRTAVESIEAAVRIQSESTERLGGFVEATQERTRENRSSAGDLEHAAADLGREAGRLRSTIDRFRLDPT